MAGHLDNPQTALKALNWQGLSWLWRFCKYSLIPAHDSSIKHFHLGKVPKVHAQVYKGLPLAKEQQVHIFKHPERQVENKYWG
jgi:hypothetical protein